ncbi:fumarylacetoacetate (FAA) hydrolase [Gregarina niphandrodes]|uniref:Fumarylacetoacetate (FAA) hydrolase n=1 Tax=Gregarina niphandrodes TaxID=110365 RepID=A0A023B7P4_GRENI|nr:fumarylacetoacetate (FAA) hydrolase [Gregarina niphandrodes]EZG67584.1 fumarylacetoacetate (FAA) hydrolase [Gregarina niphandrodes]|eukprot:XP_011130200.1 fumarylacetoacetate (FAA) hydrolase [Gregarina niphandrodes]
MPYIFDPPPVVGIPIEGTDARFPVHRVYCVGRNYEDHAREMDSGDTREDPFFFLKPADAVVAIAAQDVAEKAGGRAEKGVVRLPFPKRTSMLHPEVELVVAIGGGGSDIPVDKAMEHVFGYAVGLDLTKRDLQNDLKAKRRPWCLAKAFEQSAPVGAITPYRILANDCRTFSSPTFSPNGVVNVTGSDITGSDITGSDITGSEISLTVNGTRRQQSRITHMLWTIPEIISHLSASWTLQPGDLVFTGTPGGVSSVEINDLIKAAVEGLQPIVIRFT